MAFPGLFLVEAFLPDESRPCWVSIVSVMLEGNAAVDQLAAIEKAVAERGSRLPIDYFSCECLVAPVSVRENLKGETVMRWRGTLINEDDAPEPRGPFDDNDENQYR
jgi:hypothetical protein